MSEDDKQDRGPLSHEEAVGLLDAWVRDELDPTEAARVEAHVGACDRCEAQMEALGDGGLSAVMKGGMAAQETDVLPGVQRKIRLRSRGRYYGERQRRQMSPWPMLIGSVVVLVGLAAAYFLMGQVAGTGAPPAPSQSAPKTP